MTDNTELKRLAEAANAVTGDVSVDIAITSERGPNQSEIDAVTAFVGAATPTAVLALIAENDHLAMCAQQWEQAAMQWAAERDQLLAEVAGLRTGYEAYERVNAELKAEVGALRKLAPSKEIIWCACGDGHAANSYGAGFMDANGGVCANCDAAMGNGGRGGQSTSKTSESAYPEGLKGGGQ